MKQYTIFHPYIMSFYSKSLYDDVGQNWRGIAAFYLLVLLIIAWIPVAFIIDNTIDSFVEQQAPQLVNQVPTITIKDGKASIDKPVPYVIRDKESNKPIVVIDTSGRYKTLEEANAPVLVTDDRIYMRKENNEVREYDMAKFPNLTLGKPQINYFLQKVATWGIVILFPILVLLSFIYRIIQALIYGAIGMIFSAILKAGISYQQSLRLAIVAVTPAIILATIFSVLNIAFPYEYLFYFIISMVYLFFAVKANKINPPIVV